MMRHASENETITETDGDEVEQDNTVILRHLERGQITITFAEHDDPEAVDAVLGMLLQNLPR